MSIRRTAAALALISAAAGGMIAANPVDDAHAAVSKPTGLSMWGTPNVCTYGTSASVGWVGRHSVYYRHSVWTYSPEYGRVMKLHYTYEEWVPFANPGHPGTGSFKHYCDK